MRIKKLISVFLSVVFALSGFAFAITAFAEDEIAITEENFPDPVWRSVVMSQRIDADENGSLSAAEIKKVTSLLLSYQVPAGETITSLKGIEYFTSLTSLRCGDLSVEELDVSALTNLTSLTAQGNRLTSLDVSGNTKLVDLNVRGNSSLTSLTLGSAIQSLQCDECDLAVLDVSMCKNLTKLICYDNELTELDLSQNTALTELNCSYNHLSALDLSNCTGLSEEFSSYNTQGQTITASADFVMDYIYVSVPLPDASRVAGSNIVNPYDDNYDNEDEEVELSEYTGYNPSMRAFELTVYEQAISGFDYTYGVGIDGMEDMPVHVTVEKNFYRVRYMNGEELIDMQYVTNGGNASAPSLSGLADSACISWNGNGENITQDTDIYTITTDEHRYIVTAFDPDTGVATVKCSVCGHIGSVQYGSSVNASRGSSNYVAALDVNNDGVINNRDFAVLCKTFK